MSSSSDEGEPNPDHVAPTEPMESTAGRDARVMAEVHARLFAPRPATTRIGRFAVLEQLGRGAMGAVYAAYDEQLDRKVAIKVMLADELPDEEFRLRFVREAQALARLSHPNVVTIHEVGDSDGELFLAMEFVRGQTVGDWLRTKPGWEQILGAFVQAGRGLAAAHEAGLVHRDLKPHNLMRGDDGVVKVLDFGLVRIEEDKETRPSSEVLESISSLPPTSSLTVPGTTMGTPAYMSPEQFTGGVVDARSDQYSFCMALWEGLTGRRTFVGSSYEELLEARMAGPPAWPQEVASVPRSVIDALRRGLSVAPDDRWPSMDALLDVLSRSPQRRRSGWLLGGLGVAALAVGWFGLRRTPPPEVEERCTGAHQQLAGIWDDERRATVEAAMGGVARSYAKDTWRRTSDELDAYADAWESMHTEACRATSVRGEQSPRILDLRMRCLGRAAGGLRAVADTLADADEAVVDKAHELLGTLSPLSRCEDIEALEAEVEPPRPEDAAAVEVAREHLARAKSQRVAGRHEAARAAVTDAAAALEGVSYEPVGTEVMLERGYVHSSQGEHDEARDVLRQALALAFERNQQDLAARAAIELLHVVGCEQLSFDETTLLEPVALGLAYPDATKEIVARSAIACARYEKAEYDEAEAETRRLVALCEATPDVDPVVRARQHNLLGNILKIQGRYPESESEYRAALASMEAALGPEHPQVAGVRANLGDTLGAQGKFEESETELSKALADAKRSLGPDHPHIASMHGQLATLFYSRGQYEAAGDELRAAIASTVRTFGPEHPEVGSLRDNLGSILYLQGRTEEAEQEHRGALAAKLEAFGPYHPEIAYSRSNLALVLEAQGQLDEAEAEARAAVALAERTLDPEHQDIAAMKETLATVLRARGEDEEADALTGGPSSH